MGETDFQIGFGKNGFCITRRRSKRLLVVTTNRKTVTAISAISAAEDVILAFLILKGKIHMLRCYASEALRDDTVLGVSDSGYLNDLSFECLQHLERHTQKK